jgi:sec-independent protein translocase protein TatC
MTDEITEPIEEKEMSIWDHVAELRNRLLWGIGAMVVTTGACIGYLAPLFIKWLSLPAGDTTFIAIEVTETFSVYMRVSLLGGFIMALPVIVYQIIAFVIPGLYENEKRWVFIAVPMATLLFLSGAAFSYYLMLPAAIPFLQGFLRDLSTPSWRLSNYIEFVTNLMFWIGLAFETPLVVFMLAKFNVVTWRVLLAQWRFAVVIIAVIAAMITPTVDPFNMALLMAPLFAIYLLSVLFAAIARRNAD